MSKHLLSKLTIFICLASASANAATLVEGRSVTTGPTFYENAEILHVLQAGGVEIKILDGQREGQIITVPPDEAPQLADPITCFGSLCAGDRTVTREYENAIVQQIFRGGAARLQIIDGPRMGQVITNGNVFFEHLTKPVRCAKGICTSDTVVNKQVNYPTGEFAVVLQPFQDGAVRMLIVSGSRKGQIVTHPAQDRRTLLVRTRAQAWSCPQFFL